MNDDNGGAPASTAGLGVGPDEDLVRVIAKMLSARGWFIDVKASRINEHFAVSECPQAGWALREVTSLATVCNCHLHKRGESTGGWYCNVHGQQL